MLKNPITLTLRARRCHDGATALPSTYLSGLGSLGNCPVRDQFFPFLVRGLAAVRGSGGVVSNRLADRRQPIEMPGRELADGGFVVPKVGDKRLIRFGSVQVGIRVTMEQVQDDFSLTTGVFLVLLQEVVEFQILSGRPANPVAQSLNSGIANVRAAIPQGIDDEANVIERRTAVDAGAPQNRRAFNIGLFVGLGHERGDHLGGRFFIGDLLGDALKDDLSPAGRFRFERFFRRPFRDGFATLGARVVAGDAFIPVEKTPDQAVRLQGVFTGARP